jgi:hypothetical protein
MQFGHGGAPVETMRFTTEPAGSGLNAAGSVAITELARTLKLGSSFRFPTAKSACRRFCVASGTDCESTFGTVVLVPVPRLALLPVIGRPEAEPLLGAEPEDVAG